MCDSSLDDPWAQVDRGQDLGWSASSGSGSNRGCPGRPVALSGPASRKLLPRKLKVEPKRRDPAASLLEQVLEPWPWSEEEGAKRQKRRAEEEATGRPAVARAKFDLSFGTGSAQWAIQEASRQK